MKIILYNNYSETSKLNKTKAKYEELQEELNAQKENEENNEKC